MDAALAIAGAFALGWILASRRLRARFILTDRALHLQETRAYLDDVEAYVNANAEAWLRAVLAEDDDTDGLTVPPPGWWNR